MKKVLALILAFTMVFSTVSFVFAEEEAVVSDEGTALATLGMLEGDGGGYTAEYEAKEMTRLTAAAALLKLKGLYEEAIEYDGEDNFPDVAEYAWEGGRNLMAYLKANPSLGFAGDAEGNFNPGANINEQSYYKVLLETLGYKQTTADVVGDFAWEDTLAFAEEVGLVPANVEVFTIADLAKATVATLKNETKDGVVYLDTLIEAGIVDEEKAVAAGFVEEAPELVEVEVKEAKAIGNAAVDVKFKAEIGEEAENLDNYSINGLEILDAALVSEKVVRLETEPMSKGKVYYLVVGEKTVKFTGIAKVSGGPEIDKVEALDVEEVVITFNKNVDLVTGMDIENYSLTGNVEIVKAEVDAKKVILTTEGLQNKTKYTVKVTNIKSIDGVVKKSASKIFTSKYDLTAPGIKSAEAQTNQRVVITFNEEVTQESAEDLENYAIKLNKTDGEELEVLEVIWDDDDEDNVEIVTEAMEKNKEYKISIVNISDQRKVANINTRAITKTFKGVGEDTKGPKWESLTVLSPTTILVTFTDESKIDEESVLDFNNYELKDLDIEDIETVTNEWKTFRAKLTVEEMETGKNYDLKITDILDEFGNSMNETKKSARASATSFASAKLDTAKVTKKNQIVLTFTGGELEKTTAEDIANYDITKGIGSPIKAKLKDDKTTVELEVNDLINGYGDYKVIVDGVEDLAGNELYYEKKANNTDKWDNSAPAVEDVDLLNRYVVALTFDEKVEYDPSVELLLSNDFDEENNTVNDNSPIRLKAKHLTDDDTVIEFSSANKLNDEEYTVVKVVYKDVYDAEHDGGITDLIGNPLKAIKKLEFVFSGTDTEEEGPYMDNVEQVNGVTFKVTMSTDVKLKDGDPSKIVTTNGLTFTITIDADDDDVVNFVADDAIEEDEEYEFKFATLFEDYHGFAAVEDDEEADKTVLTGEYTDEDEPYIEEVVAVDRETIKVVFSEDIKNQDIAGHFKLKNYDLDSKEIGLTADGSKVNGIKDNKLYLIVPSTKALELRYEYELKFVKDKKIYDLAGNEWKSGEEFYYFQGTNLAK